MRCDYPLLFQYTNMLSISKQEPGLSSELESANTLIGASQPPKSWHLNDHFVSCPCYLR